MRISKALLFPTPPPPNFIYLNELLPRERGRRILLHVNCIPSTVPHYFMYHIKTRRLEHCQPDANMSGTYDHRSGTTNQDDLLFNLDDKHLLSYGYLFQYLHLMLKGQNPFIAFLRASTHSFSSQSHTKPLLVKLLCQAWNAFARLLDINFTATFACPVCGPSPTTIFCDGTLLDFRKYLMDTLDNDSPTPSTDQPIQ